LSSKTNAPRAAGPPERARSKRPREPLARIVCLALAAAAHIALLVFLVVDMRTEEAAPTPQAAVLKLVDIQEYAPPAPPPPPPPPAAPPPVQHTAEAIAEEVVEVEELEPQTETAASSAPSVQPSAGTGPEYLPQHKLSVLPAFDKAALTKRTVYPRIAQRAGIEGSVILELFIDREGYVIIVNILQETPEGRGFGEAAEKAFLGFRVETRAQANGEYVAARIRWPVSFKLQ
jgi:protein TonB